MVNKMDTSFVLEQKMEDLLLCDDIISYFNLAEKTKGHVNTPAGNLIVPSHKDSTDAVLKDVDLINRYVNELRKITDQYIANYPMCDAYSPWRIIEDMNIQHYAPGQGYKSWHTERTEANSIFSNRHLVFMTYLNDVDDGGTEFYAQNTIIKAEKGKTVIWPADWTHTHRGQVSNTKEKFVITGWFSYVNQEYI